MTLSPNVFRRLTGQPDVTRLNHKKTALILVEFQTEHFSGLLPVPNAHSLIPPAVKMMDWADKHKIKVFHVAHLAKSPASPVFAPDGDGATFYPPVEPRKTHSSVTKYASSVFTGTMLHTELEALGIDTLIFGGMSTPTTILTSVHDAQLLGYKSLVASDLTAARDVLSWNGMHILTAAKMQETALAGIADKFAQVMPCADITAIPFV